MLPIKLKIDLSNTGSYLAWRVASIITVGVMCASVIISVYFIYQNIFRTLEDANIIVLLNSAVNIDVINLPAYDKANDYLRLKVNNAQVPLNIRNIFSYGNQTSASPTPTSTKK